MTRRRAFSVPSLVLLLLVRWLTLSTLHRRNGDADAPHSAPCHSAQVCVRRSSRLWVWRASRESFLEA